EVDDLRALDLVRHQVITNAKAALVKELDAALADGYERLLKSSIEVDVRLALKERADAEAIKVFAENLRNLLLQSPLGDKRVLAVDPGFRTGCKCVVVDNKGDLVDHTVIYPTTGRVNEAESVVEGLCKKHRVEAIAVGNGTAGRETESFLRKLAKES